MPDRTEADAHLRRARRSLRLWALAGGVPEPLVEGPRVPTRSQLQLTRVQLGAQVRIRCAAVRAGLAADAAALSGRGIADFDDRVRQAFGRVTGELDAEVAARLAEIGLPSGPCAALPVADLLPPRRRPRLENLLTTLLGTGFGAGVSLTVGRLLAQLRPDLMPAVALACGLVGLGLTAWTVAARRLLAERAAAERWMLEALANLRPALEERVLTRILRAEAALRGNPN